MSVREIDGEVFLFDRSSSKMSALNKTASVIWNGMTKGLSEEQIADTICERFEVDRAVAGDDVAEFLRRLSEKKLVT